MDRISGLPDTILHDILSRLSYKDAARTIVLSKAWRETWSTFPILYFHEKQFIAGYNKVGKDFFKEKKIFIDCVKKTLLRFRDQGLAIKEFRLNLINYDRHNISGNIDLWMKLAVDSGVEVLSLGLGGGSANNVDMDVDQLCTFPPGVLEAKSLNKLELTGRVKLDRIVLNHSIQDFSLRVLCFEGVLWLDEGIIERLISRCPLIEQLKLKPYVYDPKVYDAYAPPYRRLHVVRTLQLKSLRMNGLKKLKSVHIEGMQEVYIDAPNLENLSYYSSYMRLSSPFKLNINNCRNLRRLELSCFMKRAVIADKWLLELFSNSPILESLKLNNCRVSKSISISSAQLKVLELSHCSFLKEVNIDAPNLLSCVCRSSGENMPVISFQRSSSKLEVKITGYIHFRNLYNLREIIQNFKTHKVLALLSLSICGSHEIEPNPGALQVSSDLPFVKHLHLHDAPKDEAMYLPLVNLLLSSCRPETISLSLHSYSGCEAFGEFLLETLSGRNRDKCYCSSGHSKCWWHDLKNVKVTRSVRTIYQNHPLDAFTRLCTEEETISFRLEL